MRSRLCCSRTFGLALVFAVAGFCYAVASAPRGVSSLVEDRGVGSSLPLRFTNPKVVVKGVTTAEFDLGDVAGTSVITRYVSAEGGLRPYRFTSQGTQSLAAAVGATDSTLTLGLSGIISGRMATRIPAVAAILLGSSSYLTTAGTPGFRFTVSLQDAKGTSGDIVNGFFNLFFVDAATFKFSIDALPSARLGSSYMTKVETIGGTGASTITVTSISGAAATQKDLGLFVATDGTIYGKPLVAGTVTLTLHAVDQRNLVALNRAKSAPDQVLTLTINPNTVNASDMVTTSCSVSGDTATVGRDKLSYTGVVNVLGQDNFQLTSSVVTFHLGGISFIGTVGKKGQFSAILADKSKLSVKISSKTGVFTAKISNGNFTAALNAKTFKNGDKTRESLGVVVGDAVAATEVLDFATRVSGTKYSLSYRIGGTGSNAGGSFQIVKARGKDQTGVNGAPADTWNINFVAMAPLGMGATQGISGVSSATVRIGTNFIQKLAVSGNGKSTNFHSSTGGVRRFSLQDKTGKGTLTTSALAPSQTGLQPASQAPRFGNIFFPLGLDLTRTGAAFTGEHARRIFGLKNTYEDVPPGK
jgi:hypothetical protein